MPLVPSSKATAHLILEMAWPSMSRMLLSLMLMILTSKQPAAADDDADAQHELDIQRAKVASIEEQLAKHGNEAAELRMNTAIYSRMQWHMHAD